MLSAVLAGFALAFTAETAAPADARTVPKAYIGAFCGPIALSDAGTGSLMQHLSDWGARAASDTAAYAARPTDADAPGQLFSFKEADAPAAFVDRRRGVCSLVYPGAHMPDVALHELDTETLPVNGKGPPPSWRRTTRVHFGPPGPIRYFLKVGEGEGFGLCSTIFEDLRLRDGTPATMVRVSTCRLAPDEKLDNG